MLNRHIIALKTICSIGLLILTGLASWASPAPVADKPPKPADLYIELKTVPPEENAIINWRRAGELKVALNEKQLQLLKFCWTPAAREPAAEDLRNLQAWVAANQAGLELFNASLAKPSAQWPKHDDEQDRQPEILGLSIFVRVRLFTADQLAEQGKFEAAGKSLEETLKLTQMGVDGEPALMHYLVACNMRNLTQDSIVRLASRKQAPLELLDNLLSDLPSLDTETTNYLRVLRTEFSRDYNEKLDAERLSKFYSAITKAKVAELLFPIDCQRPLKVLLDPSLVAAHPKPYDLNADLEASERHFRIYWTNVCSAWSDRDGEVELEREENRTNLLADIAPLMEVVANEPLPLSHQAAQRARAAYLQLINPVGRILDCSFTGFIGSDRKIFQVRTEREATRAALALLIFERKKGILPEKLSDLVEGKILKSVPSDPFSGAGLLYSRARRILWSVGEDGTDDGGKAGRLRWAGDDAVWHIPEVK